MNFEADRSYRLTKNKIVQRKLAEYRRQNPTPIQYRNFYPPNRRIALLEKYEVDNAYLAREFFGEASLFTGPYPSLDDPWENYPGLADAMLKDISEFVESYQLPRRKRTLESRVRNGIKSLPAMNWFRRIA